MVIITDLLVTIEEDHPPVRGSRNGNNSNIDRNYAEIAKRLQRQYLSYNPKFYV